MPTASYQPLVCGPRLKVLPPGLRPTEGRRGGGFGSAKENKIIEAAAMRFVARDYSNLGWTVTDVSAQPLGYDLLCKKRRQVAHVEVKGSSGSILQFILTENERRTWAVDPAFVLAMVTKAGIKPKIYRFPGAHAMKHFRFKPLSYFACAKRARP